MRKQHNSSSVKDVGKRKRLNNLIKALKVCMILPIILPFFYIGDLYQNEANENNDDLQNNILLVPDVSSKANIIRAKRDVVDDTSHEKVKAKEDDGDVRQNKLTVVITTFKQPICLERMIQLMKSCPVVVAEIRVNWFEDIDPNQFHSQYHNQGDVPVIFDKYPNKLSNRFQPRDFRTDAVFSVDVDMYYSCESLAKAFDTWKNSNKVQSSHNNTIPSTLGFHGRYVRSNGKYASSASYRKASSFTYNTVFVTKGGITHNSVFDEYFKDEYKALRNYVDKYMTGEDILMSFILDKMKSKIIFTCVEAHSICYVNCQQNALPSLHGRASKFRMNVTLFFWDHFGRESAFPTKIMGSENIDWQGEPQNEECMALNREKYGNIPPCDKFCNRNVVCPSHVWGEIAKNDYRWGEYNI